MHGCVHALMLGGKTQPPLFNELLEYVESRGQAFIKMSSLSSSQMSLHTVTHCFHYPAVIVIISGVPYRLLLVLFAFTSPLFFRFRCDSCLLDRHLFEHAYTRRQSCCCIFLTACLIVCAVFSFFCLLISLERSTFVMKRRRLSPSSRNSQTQSELYVR